MFNTAGVNAALNGAGAAFPYLSIHTDTDLASSANESTAPRIAANWATSTAAELVAQVAFTGGTPTGPARRVGYWSAQTGGTYGGSSLLTGDQTFNAAGEYSDLTVTEDGSAS